MTTRTDDAFVIDAGAAAMAGLSREAFRDLPDLQREDWRQVARRAWDAMTQAMREQMEAHQRAVMQCQLPQKVVRPADCRALKCGGHQIAMDNPDIPPLTICTEAGCKYAAQAYGGRLDS